MKPLSIINKPKHPKKEEEEQGNKTKAQQKNHLRG
jgi:hypothetical protein